MVKHTARGYHVQEAGIKHLLDPDMQMYNSQVLMAHARGCKLSAIMTLANTHPELKRRILDLCEATKQTQTKLFVTFGQLQTLFELLPQSRVATTPPGITKKMSGLPRNPIHVCDVCGNGLVNASALRQHKKRMHAKVKHRVPCKECNHSATSVSNLKKHMVRMHSSARKLAHATVRKNAADAADAVVATVATAETSMPIIGLNEEEMGPNDSAESEDGCDDDENRRRPGNGKAERMEDPVCERQGPPPQQTAMSSSSSSSQLPGGIVEECSHVAIRITSGVVSASSRHGNAEIMVIDDADSGQEGRPEHVQSANPVENLGIMRYNVDDFKEYLTPDGQIGLYAALAKIARKNTDQIRYWIKDKSEIHAIVGKFPRRDFRKSNGQKYSTPVCTLAQLLAIAGHLPGETGKQIREECSQVAIRLAAGDRDLEAATHLRRETLPVAAEVQLMQGLPRSEAAANLTDFEGIVGRIQQPVNAFNVGIGGIDDDDDMDEDMGGGDGEEGYTAGAGALRPEGVPVCLDGTHQVCKVIVMIQSYCADMEPQSKERLLSEALWTLREAFAAGRYDQRRLQQAPAGDVPLQQSAPRSRAIQRPALHAAWRGSNGNTLVGECQLCGHENCASMVMPMVYLIDATFQYHAELYAVTNVAFGCTRKACRATQRGKGMESVPVASPRPLPHRKVWVRTYGLLDTTLCYCCQTESISFTKNNFHMGHVISVSQGGSSASSNLRPICAQCNTSMGTEAMHVYMARTGVTPPPAIPEHIVRNYLELTGLTKQQQQAVCAPKPLSVY